MPVILFLHSGCILYLIVSTKESLSTDSHGTACKLETENLRLLIVMVIRPSPMQKSTSNFFGTHLYAT